MVVDGGRAMKRDRKSEGKEERGWAKRGQAEWAAWVGGGGTKKLGESKRRTREGTVKEGAGWRTHARKEKDERGATAGKGEEGWITVLASSVPTRCESGTLRAADGGE